MSIFWPGMQRDQLGALPLQPATGLYSEETFQVSVSVSPIFLEEQSAPAEDHYVWAYQIRIVNDGEQILQLHSRHWIITDATGFMQEVNGSGVVGEFPVLRPGEIFEYTSGASLSTPSGMMHGHYQMHTEDGNVVRVRIPAFSLDSPHQLISLN